jgi:hypothetical protein
MGNYITRIKTQANAPDLELHNNRPRKIKTPHYPAAFHRIGPHLGYKTFANEQERDRSFYLQYYLSLYGLAPKVYRKIRHGFWTEAVPRTAKNEWDYKVFNDIYYDVLHQLDKKCRNVGIINQDIHNDNWGYLYGTPVLIDVGRCYIDEHFIRWINGSLHR